LLILAISSILEPTLCPKQGLHYVVSLRKLGKWAEMYKQLLDKCGYIQHFICQIFRRECAADFNINNNHSDKAPLKTHLIASLSKTEQICKKTRMPMLKGSTEHHSNRCWGLGRSDVCPTLILYCVEADSTTQHVTSKVTTNQARFAQ